MTYHTYRCPHCNSVVGGATGDPSQIGDPFHTCPFCRKAYVDSYSKEWINMSPIQRFLYYTDRSIVLGLLSAIGISAILIIADVHMIISLVLGLCSGVLLTLLSFLIRRENILEGISRSLDRTKSKKHTEMLAKAGYRFYEINGYEYGTVDDIETDTNDDCESNEKGIKPSKDNAVSHPKELK